MKIDQAKLDEWTTMARRDDWHMTFVGSDIRQMLGEIERLRAALRTNFCPDGRGDTIGQCVDSGFCGCSNGPALVSGYKPFALETPMPVTDK